jgi:hypothetical protein
VFAELAPYGCLQLVICGHSPPMRLNCDGELETLAPAAFSTPLGMHPDFHASRYSVYTGGRLMFFTDGLLEARDRAGQFFRLDQHIPVLRRADLQSAADELLNRLRVHTRHRLNDDIALLLVELTLTESAGTACDQHPCPATPGQLPPGDQGQRPLRQVKSRYPAEGITLVHTGNPVDGTWNLLVSTPRGDRPVILRLAANGAAVTGSANRIAVEDGAWNDGELTFSAPLTRSKCRSGKPTISLATSAASASPVITAVALPDCPVRVLPRPVDRPRASLPSEEG